VIGRVLRVSGWLSLVAATVSSAQPAEEAHASADAAPWDDELLTGPHLRPILGARLEALVAAGTNETRNAALRATERSGPFAVELDGHTEGREGLTHHDANGRARVGNANARLEAIGDYNVLEQGALSLTTRSYGARGLLLSKSTRVLGLDHELGLGGGAVELAGDVTDDDPEMEPHGKSLRTLRGKHRYIDAYIHDTIRVIEQLDIRGGFVFEHWKWLTSYHPRHDDNEMAEEIAVPEATEAVLSPRVSAIYRVDDQIALRGDAFRTLRPPTFEEIYAAQVRPEVVSTLELGPRITAGPLEASTAVFWSESASPLVAVRSADGSAALVNADASHATGVDTAASLRATKSWRATVGYTYAHSIITRADAYPELVATQSALVPRHRATAAVTFDEPKLVTLTGAVRYVSRQLYDGAYTVVDALAMRKLAGGVAGYLSVDNIFDRRYVTNATAIDANGIPRTIAIGVRVDSAKF